MRLTMLDSLSTPGNPDKLNDDAYCATGNFAAVLDGATSLGDPLLPGPSDAAWVATCGAERLAHHSESCQGRDLLRVALADVEARFVSERLRAPEAVYELPMASLMMVQPTSEAELTAFWFGDCGALVKRPGEPVGIVGDAFTKRAGESGSAAALGAANGVSPAGNWNRTEFLTALRESRNRYNGGGGVWVFCPDVRCAEHAKTSTMSAPPSTLVLLASDGFLALATDYALYDAEALLQAASARGLDALLAELRAIENEDPGGDRFPRFKTSDDATAILLRIDG